MEACVVICRTNKTASRRGKILLIDAKNEFIRKNAQSWLDEEHIKKIAEAYDAYTDIDGFAKVITIEDTVKNGYSLSIPLYLQEKNGKPVDTRSAAECAASWLERASGTWKEYEKLTALLGGAADAI